MFATDTVMTRLHRLQQQQQQQRRHWSCSVPHSSIIVILILFMMSDGGLTLMTAFHIPSSSSSSSSTFYSPSFIPISSSRSNLPIMMMTRPSSPLRQYRRRWNLFQWKLSSNKDQWEEDVIIISPDLSEYFSKQQQQQQQPSAISPSAQTETKQSSETTPTKTTSTTASSPSSSSSLLSVKNEDMNMDDIKEGDDSNIVKQIVAELQTIIENGVKNKNMISDIMTSIQQLQRIQQQWNIRNGSINDSNNNDDDKLILMKNPKKRSSNSGSIKKNKGGLAPSAATTTTTTAVTSSSRQQQRSSLSFSTILQRLKQTTSNYDDEISYRLLWVGSDDTISAFGTGLHKVPLARLQEVFISVSLPNTKAKGLKNKSNNDNNRFCMTTTEVIRILGPFPNIKNTLQGSCSVSRAPNGIAERWDISWNSMIDGTGKELIGSSNDDVRHVPTLNMLYGDEHIIVASIMPSNEGTTSNISGSSGDAMSHALPPTAVESILLFVREMEMEEKLTALRVL